MPATGHGNSIFSASIQAMIIRAKICEIEADMTGACQIYSQIMDSINFNDLSRFINEKASGVKVYEEHFLQLQNIVRSNLDLIQKIEISRINNYLRLVFSDNQGA